jgi:hypothetical protein
MSIRLFSQTRLPSWSEWLTVIFISLAAPWIAAFVHSADVYRRGLRLYNAQIGGFYFDSMGMARQPDASEVVRWILVCSIPAIPTFLVLLPFRKRPMYLRAAWICLVVFWTWVYFKSEIAIA